MKRYLMIGTVAAVLAGGGVAMAQMPPAAPGGDGQQAPMDGHRGMMGRWHHHHPFMAFGTAFRFKRGDNEVDVRCSERDSVQDCVNGATTLLDKLNSAQAKPAQ